MILLHLLQKRFTNITSIFSNTLDVSRFGRVDLSVRCVQLFDFGGPLGEHVPPAPSSGASGLMCTCSGLHATKRVDVNSVTLDPIP